MTTFIYTLIVPIFYALQPTFKFYDALLEIGLFTETKMDFIQKEELTLILQRIRTEHVKYVACTALRSSPHTFLMPKSTKQKVICFQFLRKAVSDLSRNEINFLLI